MYPLNKVFVGFLIFFAFLIDPNYAVMSDGSKRALTTFEIPDKYLENTVNIDKVIAPPEQQQ